MEPNSGTPVATRKLRATPETMQGGASDPKQPKSASAVDSGAGDTNLAAKKKKKKKTSGIVIKPVTREP